MPALNRPSAPEIVLCRHGRTRLNIGVERIRGWQNIPLDQLGIDQSKGLAKDIAEHAPAVIFTSDLSRSRETAEIIDDAIPRRVQIIAMMELRPWNVGDLTGRPVEQIKPELLRLLKAKTEPVPGGESYAQFAERFVSAFVKITEFARKLGKPIVVVTHSRGIRLIRALLNGGIKAVMTAPPDDVLLKDEDPIEPSGHAVLRWSGRRWEWTGQTDSVHTPETGPKSDRSKLRTLGS